jgi:nicotinate-nucleotide adenylyltransferase
VKIGVFGGTFDPPHIGHMVAAQDACVALSLDRLLFVPAAEPPHKSGNVVTSANVRLAMLRAAVADNPRFEICTLELDRSGPSYSVDTLRELRNVYPGAALHLLIGVDQVREFRTWRAADEVLELAQIGMLAREGAEIPPGADFVKETVPVTRIDVSSTLIRERVRAGKPIHYLVPDAVAEIIRQERLYSEIC